MEFKTGMLVWIASARVPQNVKQYRVIDMGKTYIYCRGTLDERWPSQISLLFEKPGYPEAFDDEVEVKEVIKMWEIIRIGLSDDGFPGTCAFYICEDKPIEEIKRIFGVKDEPDWNRFPRYPGHDYMKTPRSYYTQG